MKNLNDYIKKNNIRLIIFDIDGTIKDLYSEHKMALELAFVSLGKHNCVSTKFALFLNELGMVFFKLGSLPTNKKMQSILIFIMSIVSFTNYSRLKSYYYALYPKRPIYFKDTKQGIESLPKDVDILFASTNHYTMNIKDNISEVFCVDEPQKKIYKQLIHDKQIPHENVLIVGDNFFDDYLPAKLLGTHVKIFNMYNSKIKGALLRLL